MHSIRVQGGCQRNEGELARNSVFINVSPKEVRPTRCQAGKDCQPDSGRGSLTRTSWAARRKVGGLGAFEDLMDIGGDTSD